MLTKLLFILLAIICFGVAIFSGYLGVVCYPGIQVWTPLGLVILAGILAGSLGGTAALFEASWH